MAKRIPGFTGADIANLTNESALIAARKNQKEITMSNIEEAIDKVIAGPEKKNRIITDEEKRIIAIHEMGHTACGHVKGVLIDEKITKEDQDKEENEANDFATNLLFGEKDKYRWGKQADSLQLARIARQLATKDRVESGTLALNYAWQTEEWSIGVGALKILEPRANAPIKINSYLEKELDWECLDADCEEYLRLVTGV